MEKSASRLVFNFLSIPVLMNAACSAVALAVYGYLGTLTRHLADDYCSIHLISGNFFVNLWINYVTISDRFANFILISLSEAIWPRSVAFLPVIMLVLWVAGLVWLVRESSRLAGAGWDAPLAITLSLLLVFYVILEAPNRYQTLYWRASLAAHLAPLVFMPYLASWLLRLIRLAPSARPGRLTYPLSFLLGFFVGDFSEPADAVQIVILSFALLAAWSWAGPPRRSPTLGLLGWTLAGALAAMLVMALSPANAIRLHSAPPSLPIVVLRSFQYAYEFELDMIRVRPLPTLLSALVPLLIFYRLYVPPAPALSRAVRRRVMILLAAVPAVSYLLIAVSFSPSVYGQGFPLERTRIAGLFFLVASLMIEGAGFGALVAQWQPPLLQRLPVSLTAAVLLGLLALYPVRAAWLTLAEVPVYRVRAAAWDERELLIRRLRARGEKALVIPQFDGLEGIKELDVDPNHWSNRCAAKYYQVNSIRAIPPDEP